MGTHVCGVDIQREAYLNAFVTAILYDMDFNTFVSISTIVDESWTSFRECARERQLPSACNRAV